MKNTSDKKRFLFKPFAFLAVFILVVILGFAAVDPLLTKLRKSSTRYKGDLNCFLYGGVKCGNLNATENEIISEIKFLDLSSEEAKKLILEAQKNSQKKLEEFNQRNDLTEHEKTIKRGMELSQPYYQRVLETIDKMEKE